MNDLDRDIFLFINAASNANHLVTGLAYIAAKYLICIVPASMILLWLFGHWDKKRLALTIFFALIIAIISSWLIGQLFPVQRPFLLPLGNPLLAHRASPSFPSNHGLVMFTFACCLWLASYRWQAVLAGVMGLLVAWSRIYLGVHWPSDMAGALLVALVAAPIARSVDRFAGERIVAVFGRFQIKRQ